MPAATTRPSLDWPIRLQEAAVIRAALERAPELRDVSRFAGSIDHLHAVSRCGCGCDSVDYAEHDPAHPSRIIAQAIGTTLAGGQVGVLVWATEDAITGLEVYDLGAGDDDIKLPVPDSIHPWPPQIDSPRPRLSFAQFVCALIAVALAHAAYVFVFYRARSLTHSVLASSDLIVFALPAVLAFGGYYILLRVRRFTRIPLWISAFLLTLLSSWLSLLLPFNTYGT